ARFRPPSDVEGTRAEATRDAATPRNKSGWGPPRTNTVARNDDDEPFAAHDDDEPFRRDASTAEGGRDGRTTTPRTSAFESSGRFFGGEAGESRRTSRSGRPPAADGRISEGEGRRNFAPRFAREPRDGGDEEGNGSGERASLESSPSPQLESPGREGTDSSEGRPAFRGARTEPDGERRRAPAPEVSPRTRSERRTPDEPRRVSRGSPAAAASAFRSSTEDDPPPPRRRSPDVAADAPDGRGERASSHGGGRAPAIPRKRPRSRGTDREESRPRPRGGGEGGSEAPEAATPGPSSARAIPREERTEARAGGGAARPAPSTARASKGSPPRDAARASSIEARGSTDGGVAPASATKDCGAVGGRSPSTVEDGTSSSEVPRRRNSAGASDENFKTDRADAAARSRERGDEASRDPWGEREGGERRTEAKGKKKEKKKKRRRTESADDASPTGEEARGKTARRSGRDAETHRADPAPPWERADEASRDPDEKRGWDGPGLLRAKKTKTKKKKRRDAAAYDASMTDPSEATKTGGGFSSTDARSAAEPGATERAPSSEREDESACGLREDGARDARREEKKQKKKKKRRAESSAGDESAARRSDSTNGERTSAVDPNDNAAFDGATLAPQDGGKKRKKKKKKKMTRRDEAADDASMIHRSDSEEEATKSEDATKLSDEHGSKAEPDGNAATIGGALAPPFEGGGEARPERAPTELARTSEKRKGESGASRSERFARDPASGASSSPTTKRRKKAFGPFRVKVGRVVAVRFRKLADGGNPGVVPVRRDGGSFRATTASPPERVRRTSSERTGRSLNNGGSAPDSDDGVEVERKKGPADASGEVDLDAEAEAPAAGAAGAKRIARRKPKQYEVWSDPIPGRDDGLSLRGSWIRCVFPKSFVGARCEGNGTSRRPPRRSAEGTVVSTYGTDRGVGVRLLVDRASLRDLPHLEVVDDCDDVAVSSSERKRRKLEARIRGADKVLVEATLASAYDKVRGSKLRPGVVSHWAVRKRVVAKAAGKRPSKAERKRTKQHADALFVGDGNDAPSQQEQNWRWIASRARGPVDAGTNRSLVGNDNEQDPVSQLVGEVVRVDISPAQSENGSSSLALVTVKSLWTPEQTERGRLAHHGAFELFDFCHSDSDGSYFQAPIEDLIVIGKRISRTRVGNRSQAKAGSGAGEDPGWAFAVSHSYHPGDDTFTPLSEPGVATKRTAACHYCQKLYDCSTLHKCPHEKKGTESSWCVRCLRFVRVPVPCNDGGKWTGPCCTGECDCPVCTRNARKQSKEHNAGTTIGGIGESFLDLERSLQSVSPVDFTLPSDTGELTLRPSFLPLTGSSKSQSYGKAKSKDKKKPIAKQGKRKRKRAASVTDTNGAEKPQADVPELLEEDNIFKPECHRTTPFDYINKACWGTSKRRFVSDNAEQPFFRENARPRAVKIGKTEEKIALSGRAARANQRRMFKSLAAFGGGSKNVDRLAGRDRVQQLRFDKSRIHGWGVFTEDAIAAGDMIIEYRGELIGNAVANKRELEYERAKLDDYMFRIDAFTVCDATILGNVARYINASCRPNCHTQIITAGENKRIVIYAKRDIKRGEELCYDYKFSLEYDPSKRILCHCGSPHCRGFMNWDKKYV
ncbi:hypothetical protein ACHAWF_016203, partial [Thalassiosira exigua]